MSNTPYTESDEYQKEIAEQYKKRIGVFDPVEVANALGKLGFGNVKADVLKTITPGNMNATYVTEELVIKVSRGDKPNFPSNKIVSEKLSGKAAVVKVLTYDYFQKTPFEILVMERAPGNSLLEDIFELSQDGLKDIFRQILQTINQMCEVEFESFGWLNFEGKQSFSTFAEFFAYEFKINTEKVKNQKLCEPEDIRKAEEYFLKHVSVFDTAEKATIMHRDLSMGNFIHQGTKLTAIVDFDWSMKGPKCGNLQTLLGLIDNPSQYTEGSPYYPKYKGKNFYFLLPLLKEEMPDIFEDKNLLQKLNLIFISDGIKWIAENWSETWNKDMIKTILENELPEPKEDLNQTYFGKVLSQ